MPSVLLIATNLLGDLGALIALVGFIVGLKTFGGWKFKRPFLTPEQALALFLGASAALGFIQAYLQNKHLHNLWCGAAWDLAIVLLLAPAITSTENQFSKLFSGVLCVVWFVYFLGGGRFDQFDTLFHPVLCLLMMLLADGVIVKHEWSSRGRKQNLEVILAVSVLLGMAIDIFPYSLSSMTLCGQSGMCIQLARNGMWCIVYGAMGYTLWAK